MTGQSKGSGDRTTPPVCLSIAGLDPSGGAGVLADVRAFSAFGCFPSAVVTSVTYQNTQGVFGAEAVSPESVRAQIQPVLEDYRIAAVKTGMLPDRYVIEAVSRTLSGEYSGPLVVDPVVRSTSGFDLIDDDALNALIEMLFPVASLITPNTAEAERISGVKIVSETDIGEAARMMHRMGARAVLIKGGHLEADEPDGGPRIARDFLFRNGVREVFAAPFHDTRATHGTGCVLSSAIAACLAQGARLSDAVASAKHFVNEAIRTAPIIGKGHSPINLDTAFAVIDKSEVTEQE